MQDRKLGMVGGIVRAAQLHPWRTVEHCTIVLLALHLLSGRACHGRGGSLLCSAGQQQCCCAADTPGPLTVLTADGVTPAPLPTMSMADLQPGKTVEHHDFRGDIYRFPLGDGIILNLMRTTAGTMRSGDLHNCTQFDVILAGRAKLVTYDTVTQRETAMVYGRNDFIKIPARVPHLFEFLEDNYMVEWWDCDFRAWYYQPYRDRISRAFEAAKAKDTASKTAAAAVDTADKQASEAQPAGGNAAARAAEQRGAVGSAEQAWAEAARRQRGGEQVAQEQRTEQQQAKQPGVEGAAGRSAGTGAAQQAAGDDPGGQGAAGIGAAAAAAAAGGKVDQRESGDSQEGGAADPRLRDPVAGASEMVAAAGSSSSSAGDVQQGEASSAADSTALPAESEAQHVQKRPRQQQGSQGEASAAEVAEQFGGADNAAAEVRQGTLGSSGQEDLDGDTDGGELVADQEDYRDAELQ